MTRNPYAQLGTTGQGGVYDYGAGAGGGPGGPYDTGGFDTRPSRVSALAVAALVFGIVCVIPGAGLLAVLLGVPALFVINASRGRLRGTGLAVTGVVLGLVASAMWVLLLSGAAWFNQWAGQQIFAPIAQTMEGIESGDRTKARAQLTPALSAAVTDADLDAFRTAYQAELGEYQSMPQSLLDMFRAYMNVGQTMQNYQQQKPGNTVFPAAALFKNGWGAVVIEGEHAVGQGPGGQVMPRFINIGVVTPKGREIWLHDPAVPLPPAPAGALPAPSPGESGEQPADPQPEGEVRPPEEPMEEPDGTPQPAPDSPGGG